MWDEPKLTMLAKRLLSAIKDIEKAIQSKREAITEAAKTANAKQSVPPLVRAEVDLPQGVEIRKSAADATDDKNYQFRTLVVAWLTLAAIVIYAFISGWQLYEMRQATSATQVAASAAKSAAQTAYNTLKDAHANFQIEQRPYLVAVNTPAFVTIPIVAGVMSANVTFKNIGKTPAIRIRREISIVPYRPEKRTPQAVDRFVAFLQRNFQDLTSKLDAANTEKYSDLAREDLAPDSTTFSTAELKTPLTTADMPKLQAIGLFLYYLGIVRYTDAYQGAYETRFCYYYFGNNPAIWHICDSNNTIE